MICAANHDTGTHLDQSYLIFSQMVLFLILPFMIFEIPWVQDNHQTPGAMQSFAGNEKEAQGFLHLGCLIKGSKKGFPGSGAQGISVLENPALYSVLSLAHFPKKKKLS